MPLHPTGPRPSMLQDLQAGRKTEIGNINGVTMSEGAACGIGTPVPGIPLRLVHVLERK